MHKLFIIFMQNNTNETIIKTQYPLVNHEIMSLNDNHEHEDLEEIVPDDDVENEGVKKEDVENEGVKKEDVKKEDIEQNNNNQSNNQNNNQQAEMANIKIEQGYMDRMEPFLAEITTKTTNAQINESFYKNGVQSEDISTLTKILPLFIELGKQGLSQLYAILYLINTKKVTVSDAELKQVVQATLKFYQNHKAGKIDKSVGKLLRLIPEHMLQDTDIATEINKIYKHPDLSNLDPVIARNPMRYLGIIEYLTGRLNAALERCNVSKLNTKNVSSITLDSESSCIQALNPIEQRNLINALFFTNLMPELVDPSLVDKLVDVTNLDFKDKTMLNLVNKKLVEEMKIKPSRVEIRKALRDLKKKMESVKNEQRNRGYVDIQEEVQKKLQEKSGPKRLLFAFEFLKNQPASKLISIALESVGNLKKSFTEDNISVEDLDDAIDTYIFFYKYISVMQDEIKNFAETNKCQAISILNPKSKKDFELQEKFNSMIKSNKQNIDNKIKTTPVDMYAPQIQSFAFFAFVNLIHKNHKDISKSKYKMASEIAEFMQIKQDLLMKKTCTESSFYAPTEKDPEVQKNIELTKMLPLYKSKLRYYTEKFQHALNSIPRNNDGKIENSRYALLASSVKDILKLNTENAKMMIEDTMMCSRFKNYIQRDSNAVDLRNWIHSNDTTSVLNTVCVQDNVLQDVNTGDKYDFICTVDTRIKDMVQDGKFDNISKPLYMLILSTSKDVTVCRVSKTKEKTVKVEYYMPREKSKCKGVSGFSYGNNINLQAVMRKDGYELETKYPVTSSILALSDMMKDTKNQQGKFELQPITLLDVGGIRLNEYLYDLHKKDKVELEKLNISKNKKHEAQSQKEKEAVQEKKTPEDRLIGKRSAESMNTDEGEPSSNLKKIKASLDVDVKIEQ